MLRCALFGNSGTLSQLLLLSDLLHNCILLLLELLIVLDQAVDFICLLGSAEEYVQLVRREGRLRPDQVTSVRGRLP